MPLYQITAVARYGYQLVLNPMMGGVEQGIPFGPFPDLLMLKSFYDNEKVELYKDEGPDNYNGGTKTYSKSFRKGGPLEWCNPLMTGEIDWLNPDGSFNHHGHGIHLVLLDVSQVQRQYKIG